MTETPSTDAHVSIAVPADPSFASVLRAVAAAVAARLDLPIDDLEDLRLAVDEAFASLLTLCDGGTRITLRLTPVGGGVTAYLVTDGTGTSWPPAAGELARQVLTALADEVTFDAREGAPSVSIVKRSTRG